MDAFEVVCEIEPATRPDLTRVRHQIGVLSTIAARFLIPDNHIGRATVSSIAVAHEVAQMGCYAVACINARDRNLLGFRRDLVAIFQQLRQQGIQSAAVVRRQLAARVQQIG